MSSQPSAVLAAIERVRVLPVVVIDDAARAVELASALASGGINCAEITLRTDAAIESIAAISSALPDFAVGAGTVLSIDDVERVRDAGASFVVSPGLDEEVVDRAREGGMLAVPGIATATEVQRAIRTGLDRLKFFPAGQLGGRSTIDALAAPFPGVRFVPSGGVDASNADDYLASAAVFAVSGSWVAPRALIGAGDWDTIQRLSSEAARRLP